MFGFPPVQLDPNRRLVRAPENPVVHQALLDPAAGGDAMLNARELERADQIDGQVQGQPSDTLLVDLRHPRAH